MLKSKFENNFMDDMYGKKRTTDRKRQAEKVLDRRWKKRPHQGIGRLGVLNYKEVKEIEIKAVI